MRHRVVARRALAPQKREWPSAHLSSYARAIVPHFTGRVNSRAAEGDEAAGGIIDLIEALLPTAERRPRLDHEPTVSTTIPLRAANDDEPPDANLTRTGADDRVFAGTTGEPFDGPRYVVDMRRRRGGAITVP